MTMPYHDIGVPPVPHGAENKDRKGESKQRGTICRRNMQEDNKAEGFMGSERKKANIRVTGSENAKKNAYGNNTVEKNIEFIQEKKYFTKIICSKLAAENAVK